MQSLNSGFDAQQLLHIIKNCKRWCGIETLPSSIQKKFQELDALTECLQPQTPTMKGLSEVLVVVNHSCATLRNEFSKAQISFVCPTCPLRPGSDGGLN